MSGTWPSARVGRFALGRGLLVAVALVPLCMGCETRDRSNPFDPGNPDTGGVPPLVRAVAGDGSVSLEWSLEGYGDIRRIDLLREIEAGGPDVLLSGAARAGDLLDREVENGTTYTYRLLVVPGTGDPLSSRDEPATPGSARVFFGDASGGGLGRLAPDGRDLLFRRETFRGLLDLAVQADGTLWAADFFSGEVVHYSADGERLGGIFRPGANAVALELASGQVWVGSFTEQSLSRYGTGGGLTFELGGVGPIEDLEAEPLPRTGVWAAVRGVGVVQVTNDAVERRWDSFTWPVALGRDPGGWVWVVDRGAPQVAQIYASSGMIVPGEAELGDPRDLSLDGEGGVWIADPVRGGVLRLDSSAREVAFLPLGPASAVTWDPVRAELWVVFRELGRVGIFGPDGTERVRLTVGGSPVKIEADWDG